MRMKYKHKLWLQGVLLGWGLVVFATSFTNQILAVFKKRVSVSSVA